MRQFCGLLLIILLPLTCSEGQVMTETPTEYQTQPIFNNPSICTVYSRAIELGLKFPEAILAVWFMENSLKFESADRHEPNGSISYGPFMINSIHRIDPNKARDFNFSLDWAIRYLKKFQYRGLYGMLKKYNGTGEQAELYANKAIQWLISQGWDTDYYQPYKG